MKILVTGATGFVGREVLRQLHAAGHSVRVVARGARPDAARLPRPNSVADAKRSSGRLASARRSAASIPDGTLTPLFDKAGGSSSRIA